MDFGSTRQQCIIVKQNSPAVQSSNVERLADYVDPETTIFDIVTRYPLSPKMIACACCADLRDGSSMAP